MKKPGKNITKARQAVEKRPYALNEAVPLLQKVRYAKFDETVEITMRLGVDPKHADQMVRGTVVLPHGLGKSKRVLVIAGGEKVKEAEQAGADFVGGEEMVEKINKENWTDFDALVATPDMMKSVGRLGKVRPQGADAESEDWYGHLRRCPGRAGGQGRQSGISHRQNVSGARARGKDFLSLGKADRKRHGADHERGEGETGGGERQVCEGLLSQLEHGPWHCG